MNNDQTMNMVVKSISEDIANLNERMSYIEFVITQLVNGLEEVGILSTDEESDEDSTDETQVEIPFPTLE